MATIRERNGTYQIRVSLGYNMQGKQIIKTASWKPPPGMTARQIEKELQRQAALFEDKAKNGLVMDGGTRFADYAERWLSLNEKNFAPSTIARYEYQLSHANKAIGHIKLSRLQAQHLQELYKNLAEPGMNQRTGGALSENTILSFHKMIKAMLQEAFKQGYVTRNVAQLVTPPKVKEKDVTYLDEADIMKVYDALLSEHIKWRTALLLLLFVGMRKGELIGLEWSDIDFKSRVIHIHRNTQAVYGKKYEHINDNGKLRKGIIIDKETKTKGSNRYVSVDDGVISLLIDYRRWWKEQRLLNADRWIETDKLFIQENGGVMHPTSITKYTSAFCDKYGLPHFSPHSLRHTNISIMIAEGVDIKTVSSRAGHSSPTITANVYTHQIQSANAKAAEKIGNVFNNVIKLLNTKNRA